MMGDKVRFFPGRAAPFIMIILGVAMTGLGLSSESGLLLVIGAVMGSCGLFWACARLISGLRD